MKIDYIESALQVLKDEDETELIKVKEKIKTIEELLSKYQDRIENNKREITSYNILLNNNIIKRMHMFMPFIEMPLILYLIIATILSPALGYLDLLSVVVSVICACDIVFLFDGEYRHIDSENKLLIRIINVVKKMTLSKDKIEKHLDDLEMDQTLKVEQLKALNKNHNTYIAITHDLREELSFLEGNLQGLEIIKNKHNVTDLSETMSVVKYVNEKKELKLRA